MVKELVKIGVIGGGISGLTAAYLLDRQARRRALPLEVHLVDRADRLGGVIRSRQRDGYLLEWGPENFVPFKPKILELIRDLGLSDELIGSNDDRRRTYVLSPEGLYPLPDGLAFLTPVDPIAFFRTRLLSTIGKLRAICEPLIPRSRRELSVQDFLARRLGKEFTRRVAEPLISSIYGGDISRLGAAAALASTHQLEQKHGSLWKGMRKASGRRNGNRGSMFYSLRRGMSELVRALEGALPPETVHLGEKRLEISRQASRFTVKGEDFEGRFDNLVIATPAPAAAELLRKLAPQAADGLAGILYSSTTLIYLGYRRDRFSHPLDGFGFVAQRDAAKVLDACTWVSSKFEGRCPDDRVLLRCAVHNGRWQRSSRPKEALVEEVSRELKRVMDLHVDPDFADAWHVPKGMPQPDVLHNRRLEQVETALATVPGVYLVGGYRGGVGLPDCVAGAGAVSREIVDKWFPDTP